MVKPKLKIGLKIGVSCLFVGYLSFKVDSAEIAAAVKHVDLSFYLLSTLIAVLSNFFIAGKYYILIKVQVLCAFFAFRRGAGICPLDENHPQSRRPGLVSGFHYI